jgi:hypothetical protein
MPAFVFSFYFSSNPVSQSRLSVPCVRKDVLGWGTVVIQVSLFSSALDLPSNCRQTLTFSLSVRRLGIYQWILCVAQAAQLLSRTPYVGRWVCDEAEEEGSKGGMYNPPTVSANSCQ